VILEPESHIVRLKMDLFQYLWMKIRSALTAPPKQLGPKPKLDRVDYSTINGDPEIEQVYRELDEYRNSIGWDASTGVEDIF